MLQGIVSAAPLFIVNFEISLKTYRSLGTGAAFYHPINGKIFTDKTVQYVDDTSQFVNPLGAEITIEVGFFINSCHNHITGIDI